MAREVERPEAEPGRRFERTARDGEQPPADVMVHLFRGELSRSDTWRNRLDTTTNWAITVSAGVVSISFADAATPHGVLLVGIWMVCSFLLIEARRYRYYDLWIHRVRLIEDGYLAPSLRAEPADLDAMRELAHSLARPQLRLTLPAAIGTRLNRTYGPMLGVLVLTWLVKVSRHPHPARDWEGFFRNAHLGLVPGTFVLGFVLSFAFALVVVTLLALLAHRPLGELRAFPRSHRLSVWASLLRPYAATPPRRPRKARRSDAGEDGDDAG